MSLRELAATRGLLIGSAVRLGPADPLYTETLAREFSVVTPENMMKFRYIHPGQNEYDFTKADAIVDFAEQNGMWVRGHCLVWNQELPAWLTLGNWSRDELIAILRSHIKTVVGHYRGRVYAWDVVNEAITDVKGDLRKTFWYQGIGPEYIAMAFRWAHEADPDALLFYNDYAGEGLGSKSDGIYSLVKQLVDDGVPIDGIGLQMHVRLDLYPPQEDLSANMNRLAALGLEIHITEMTVMIRDGVTQQNLAQQAEIYREVLEVCLSVEQCKAFVMWGFTDRHTYFPNTDRGWAHIFDESYQPKPAYYALVEALGAYEPIEEPRPVVAIAGLMFVIALFAAMVTAATNMYKEVKKG